MRDERAAPNPARPLPDRDPDAPLHLRASFHDGAGLSRAASDALFVELDAVRTTPPH